MSKYDYKIQKAEQKAALKMQKRTLRAEKKKRKYEEKLRKQAIKNEKTSNLYTLREYINGLDVSDKVNKYLYVHAHNATPERIERLTKYYRNKEYRRIRRKYSKYF